MTQQHPITPPPELVEKWLGLWPQDALLAAAQWGADQELEACCAIALTDPVCGTKHQRRMLVSHMRERRRPEPPTFKNQAMQALREIESIGSPFVNNRTDDIRRALEQLP